MLNSLAAVLNRTLAVNKPGQGMAWGSFVGEAEKRPGDKLDSSSSERISPAGTPGNLVNAYPPEKMHL